MLDKINWFKLLIYLAIPFLCLALYRADYLVIPEIKYASSFLLSLFFLFAGFILVSENWRVTLKQDKIALITGRESIISIGLSVFTKYIPGKVMVVLSRALYVKNKYKIALNKLTFASLKTQLLTLWVGLLFGLLLLFKVELNFWIKLVAGAFLLFFSLFLFSSNFKKIINKYSQRWFNKTIDYPLLTFKSSLKILPSFVLNWLSWSLGFYFLCSSLLDYDVSLIIGLSFSLSATLAIMALIAPGGIGVREGLLALILVTLGVEKQDAITISVVSRLWFLIGEVFIFILALLLNLTESSRGLKNKE